MNPFLRVIEALNQAEARYVIVGGFAAVMHGHNRATNDLDLVIDPQPEEARKAIEALVAMGFQSRAPVDPFLFADREQRRIWAEEKGASVFTMIDPGNHLLAVALFNEPPMDWSDLWSRSKVIHAKGLSFRISALEDLIEMKIRSGRPQDMADVEALRTLENPEEPEH